ncbi:LysR family transcriptional regulator [Methanomicrobiaceae archaeon CYW5]|uniref:molybdopterin biosynthesis protein n=1 Tax=Methanovulcanius yangii TaxID=1789227 RepID=UPI0029CA6573|nr:molybdopterin biosynthesis protein [Methanovulcanius yangii]MBT8508099.1 LysR family transcriptional regulator [Methanovulcanius yangii]
MVKRYFSLVSLEEAQQTIADSFSFVPGYSRVPLSAAAGRITSAPVFARSSIPPVHLSAMDGIAVRSADTTGAHEQRPVTLHDAVRLNTGNVVPEGYDAVVMIEDVEIGADDTFVIRRAAAPWQHIRPVGEDIAESEMVIPSNHRIRAHEIGALAAYGITEVEVRDLHVGLIPTGSELVPPGTRPLPGQVVESNMQMAAAYLQELGATPRQYGIVPDDQEVIRDAIMRGVGENDMLVISAGSSKGTRDYTADLIGELGELMIHGVAIKPAKPVIIGKIEDKPVIGMPGYPLAAFTILREVIRPMMDRYGLQPPAPEQLQVHLATTLDSAAGTDEFVLLSVGNVNGRWVAVPQSRGAGVQMSAVRANAYLRIPASREGLMAGEEVSAFLSVPRRVAGESLLVTGSHDPALDYLADYLTADGVLMHSTHVGSMGGILALRQGACHTAPMHLLGEGGEYNIPYLKRYLPDEELSLICVAEREQGVISRDGLGFEDLGTARIINRQRGSGTRVLFDHLLGQKGIDPVSVAGYDHEVTTHLAVALSVSAGECDAGIGVYSAAKTLGLAFRAIGTERYEMVCRTRDVEENEQVAGLLKTIASERFRECLKHLGGYRTEETGAIRTVP